ncbi:unnamed protein product [Polarella glacialis]|uniref:RING-type domain-containing protein n=1 Tax=Polarella glacialis TaxID=89957 RepID=A0A813GX78_POLGL|nr:unnamed protein product [Polarella glacialis]
MPPTDSVICAVCLDEIKPHERRSRAGRRTGCVHVFHWECIRQWFQVKASCPVCNTSLFDYGIYEVDPSTGRQLHHRIRPEGVRGSLHTAAATGWISSSFIDADDVLLRHILSP